MKKKKINSIISAAGIASAPFILQACSSADEFNQVMQANDASQDNGAGRLMAIPMTAEDENYIQFLSKLTTDIIASPDIASKFADNPEEYCKKYGYNSNIKLDAGLMKIILALGDRQINDSIKNGDVKAFVRACRENGLISYKSLRQDAYLNKISDYISANKATFNSPLARKIQKTRATNDAGDAANEEIISSFVYGAVAVVIAAVAAEVFVVIGTTTWVTHVHGTQVDASKDDNPAIQIWDLKDGDEKTYIPADKINNELVEEGIGFIKTEFPEVLEKIDEPTLRNIILINIQKNTAYEN